MAKFSIIIPAHNSAEFIHKALDSIMVQTFTDYELLVICDACDDNTAEVAKKYTPLVFETAFGNDGMARNVGLQYASGEWILFMDDDDWWLHEYVLQMISDKLDMYDPGEIDVLIFGFIFKTVGYAAPIRKNGSIWANCWSKAWRREHIGNSRFPEIRMESDLHFCREVITNKRARVNTLNMPMYYYNFMRPGSQTEVASRDSQTVS